MKLQMGIIRHIEKTSLGETHMILLVSPKTVSQTIPRFGLRP